MAASEYSLQRYTVAKIILTRLWSVFSCFYLIVFSIVNRLFLEWNPCVESTAFTPVWTHINARRCKGYPFLIWHGLFSALETFLSKFVPFSNPLYPLSVQSTTYLSLSATLHVCSRFLFMYVHKYIPYRSCRRLHGSRVIEIDSNRLHLHSIICICDAANLSIYFSLRFCHAKPKNERKGCCFDNPLIPLIFAHDRPLGAWIVALNISENNIIVAYQKVYSRI